MKGLNSNIKKTIKRHTYQGMPLCLGERNQPIEMRTLYLDKIIRVIENAIDQYPRTLMLRVELRFPQEILYDGEGVIKRFIESLRSQVDADIKRKRKHGKKTPNCSIRYVWAKERDTSINHHYHVGLFFNKDVYYWPGKFDNESNLVYKIKRAWCSALNFDMDEGDGLVEFPKNYKYTLDGNKKNCNEKINLVFQRLSYFAKTETKEYGDRSRSFGYSLL
ncbi:inovirus Gp2 family protein [Vibrio vulnificus]|uniref:inovirus Gp2 family protein n=1 Tax=Vibrio vulnificus TaxID=672 RepID=UPI004059FCAB